MKKFLSLILAALMLLTLASCQKAPADTEADTEDTTPAEPASIDVRIVTANVLSDVVTPVNNRYESYLALLDEYKPDVLGLQEYSSQWHSSPLSTDLPEDYELLKIMNDNYVPMIYNKSKYTVVDSGHHDYPDNDQTKGYTWAVFEEKATGIRFSVLSTHWFFTYGSDIEAEANKLWSAIDVIEQFDLIKETYNCPTFIVGDFNCSIDSRAIKKLTDHGARYLWDTAADRDDAPTRIDHLISYNFDGEVAEYHAITDSFMEGASDHKPVYADVIITEPES